MPEPTKTQKTALKALQQIDPNIEIHWDEKTGTPVRIRGVLSGPQTETTEVVARQFLVANKGIFAMKAPEQELFFKGVGTDPRGNQHVRYQQMYKGLPVFGGELIVHLDRENAVRGVNGKYTARIDLPTEPTVAATDAKEVAMADAPGNQEQPTTQPLLLVLVRNGQSYLAWHITLDGIDRALDGSEAPAQWEYFVDAQTGKVIWRYNNLQTHDRTTGAGVGLYAGTATLNTVHNHTLGKYQLEDRWLPSSARVYTHDCDNAFPPKPVSEDDDNNWAATDQRAEVDAHLYTRMVFDYFLVMHGRNSYDNAGADMHINVHCGSKWNNASWDGANVKMGDGDGVQYSPFCTLDIVAHEWVHAITQYSANLIYDGESGALNESMSDVFAALIDGDWLYGEDNWLDKAEAPAGRNLADPTNGGKYNPGDPIGSVLKGHQPDHMNDRYTGELDNHGVHINSGIMNKVAYLIATGGAHRGIKICEGLGREVLGHLYYQALTQHLISTSDFAAMRDAVLDSLHDLYDGDPRYDKWEASIKNAFAAIGVGSEVTCPGVCWIAPTHCRLAPTCRVSPVILCPPSPRFECPPSPRLECPPSPRLECPPSPRLECPPSPRFECPPSPIACPPSPRLECPPSPSGCLPGPDPLPFQPKMTPRTP